MYISRVSASRIKTFLDCKFKYALEYEILLCEDCDAVIYMTNVIKRNIDLSDKHCYKCGSKNIYKPDIPSNWGAEFGSILHKILELYAKSFSNKDFSQYSNWRKLYHQIMVHGFEDTKAAPWDLAKAKDFAEVEPICQTCKFAQNGSCSITGDALAALRGCPLELYNLGLSMLESAIARYKEDFKKQLVATEHEFREEIAPGIFIQGYIDLVLKRDAKTIEAVDYKSGVFTQKYDDLRKDLQPRIYSIAVKRSFPDYEFHILNFDYFRAESIILSFTEAEDARTIQYLTKLHNEIKSTSKLVRRRFDWKCRALCDRPLCDKIWAKIKSQKGE